MMSCDAGVAAVRAGDLQRAEPILAECVRSKAATLGSFLALAMVYQSRKDEAALLAVALEGSRRFPGEQRFYLTAGTLAARKGALDDAVAVLEKAIARWPKDPKISKLFASALAVRGARHLDGGDSARAAEDLSRATTIDKTDVEAWMNLGRAQQNLLRYADALASFEQVQAAPLLHFHRGLAHYSLGNFDRAVSELDQEPDYPPAWLIRGLARLSSGDVEKALPDLEAAVAKMPNDAQARHGLGRALLRVGLAADAEGQLRKAVEIDPADPAALNTLVTALLRSGKRDEARELSRKAAQLAEERR